MAFKKKSKEEEQKQESNPQTDLDLELLAKETKDLKDERIKELESKLKEYEKKEEQFREELNKKFLETIQKKSDEAALLIKSKEEEIEQKYSSKLEEQKRYLYESQLTELVNIVSRLEDVLNVEPSSEEVKKYLFGFKMFLTQFESLFDSFNISKIVPETGQEFDSEIMESLETETVEEIQRNKILKVFSKGYKLNERVIKLAQVKVGV
ncbi:nucleotide exchange factor GrpE [Microbacterium esteraromaticum]|uniref:Protein GrpE n=1 Tax=Mycoplasma wenyonii TaxID=65123 RepID=A0A328PM87_9MOLU|nr:nucleotide exchange factor GrpE [Mycoplasma wenyonii]PYC99624.1 nucleotide exchange factor GrpE [Microbacterium esteraromaticum]RAO94845.1 nucleotide exchange factor GrpE [Mycoplasma wenyonii]